MWLQMNIAPPGGNRMIQVSLMGSRILTKARLQQDQITGPNLNMHRYINGSCETPEPSYHLHPNEHVINNMFGGNFLGRFETAIATLLVVVIVGNRKDNYQSIGLNILNQRSTIQCIGHCL